MELLHGSDQRLRGRGIHEVKRQKVVDAHGFQRQKGTSQVGALDLRHRRGEHLVSVGTLGVEAVGLARTGPASPPCPLLGLSLGDGGHDQLVHARLGVVHLLLDETRVHHVVDTVDGQGGFSNVSGNHDLWWRY